jgi:uncharacterized membrane protein
MQVTDRLEVLERRTQELTDRLARLEGGRTAWAPPVPQPVVAPRPPAVPAERLPPAAVVVSTVRAKPAAPPAAPAAQSLEDLLGGRVLAWAGGLAVVVAIVLFLAIAVSRDWIGEGARTALGGFAAFALLAAGAWLQERRERVDASWPR